MDNYQGTKPTIPIYQYIYYSHMSYKQYQSFFQVHSLKQIYFYIIKLNQDLRKEYDIKSFIYLKVKAHHIIYNEIFTL